MTQTPYRFHIMSGMPGYMPNYNSGAYYASTRKEFVAIVRDELDMLQYPASAFNDISARRVWSGVQSNRCGSCVHTSTDTYNGEHMEICGMTKAEYQDSIDSEDF